MASIQKCSGVGNSWFWSPPTINLKLLFMTQRLDASDGVNWGRIRSQVVDDFVTVGVVAVPVDIGLKMGWCGW